MAALWWQHMRLAKYLAHAGVASRRCSRGADRSRTSERGEQIVTDPARDVDAHSRVAIDGKPLDGPEPRVAYALNKPVGVVSTARDTHRRRTVLELVPARGLRLYPVGRLDLESSGLILLTNDGDLANRLTHPRYEIPKTYRARLGGAPISAQALGLLRAGVELDDGPTAPARVRRVGGAANTIELTIHEGRNRQVRRMCQAVGHSGARARAHPLRAARARRSGARSAPATGRARARTPARARQPVRRGEPRATRRQAQEPWEQAGREQAGWEQAHWEQARGNPARRGRYPGGGAL